jgi:hypothetical protein
METTKLRDRLPPATDRMALTVLLDVIEQLFEDAYRDFTANPRSDHLLVKLLILARWVCDRTSEDGDGRR